MFLFYIRVTQIARLEKGNAGREQLLISKNRLRESNKANNERNKCLTVMNEFELK